MVFQEADLNTPYSPQVAIWQEDQPLVTIAKNGLVPHWLPPETSTGGDFGPPGLLIFKGGQCNPCLNASAEFLKGEPRGFIHLMGS